ncbi:Acetyltransferase (GNAT) domain-containing protein [Catalinimonas alkaloidigena]|uniref:Acetyltransferase (GNAT) domain-containing protein n=1 Tax=Catalinimonas alkaloidigena TaxID=1075417 RepID=A0A1G9QMJ7_9BACT|nr:GNAT family N-acetyltransferase [Catalinimonas alkaloidigena]SDM12193.1 Acetyltransferase (GNAT) domain-containing protein [Catalinimonas alkaloidigena]
MWQRYDSHQIDKKRWDDCIEAACNSQVYGCSWYLDVVCPQWRAWVWEEDGEYQKVLPLTTGRKWGIPYLYQPYFTQQLGVFSRQPITATEVNSVLREATRPYWRVNYTVNTCNPPLDWPRAVWRTLPTYRLSLDQPYETLRAKYRKGHRSGVKQAARAGLSIQARPDAWQHMLYWFQHEKASVLQPRHYDTLRALYQQLCAQGCADLRAVYTPQGDFQAGALWVVYRHSVIYLFGVSSPAGRNNGSMTFLLDDCLRRYAGAGQPGRYFDFEGSQLPGIARFFRGFGAEEVPYFHLHIDRLAGVKNILGG